MEKECEMCEGTGQRFFDLVCGCCQDWEICNDCNGSGSVTVEMVRFEELPKKEGKE